MGSSAWGRVPGAHRGVSPAQKGWSLMSQQLLEPRGQRGQRLCLGGDSPAVPVFCRCQ